MTLPERSEDSQALWVQLYLDPIAELEFIDDCLRNREIGSRPGYQLLLTERRNVMRALAKSLQPPDSLPSPGARPESRVS